MGIGKKLRDAIKSQGRKNYWVAEQADIHENTLAKILDETSIPNADTLAKLARALGLSADYLLGLTDEAAS